MGCASPRLLDCLAIIAVVEWEGKPAAGNTLPLSGRTVVVTRAESQAHDLVDHLERAGARVVLFPTIEFSEPESWEPLDRAVTNLGRYDWVVFTSANGVRFFILRIKEHHPDLLSVLQSRAIAAIGPATAGALETEGFAATLVAEDSKGEGALAALVARVGGESNIRGLGFLIPRAAIAREVLPEGLRRLGAIVDTAEVYRTVRPAQDVSPMIRLFEERLVDAVTFTSSSTVSNFSEMVGTRNLSRFLEGVVVACIGPVTAATAAEHGLKHVIQPKKYTASALAELLSGTLG